VFLAKRMKVLLDIACVRSADPPVAAALPSLKRRLLDKRRSFVSRTMALTQSPLSLQS
jgi:hypothetical protein